MNWAAIDAVSNVVATVAVVATLIYLALQIRHANRESRISALHDISALYIGWMQSMAESDELTRIWDVGITNYESLDRTESVRFLLLMGIGTRIFDDAHSQYAAGRMEKSDWAMYDYMLDLVVGSAGFAAYFSQRKRGHSPGFSRLLENKRSASNKANEPIYQ